MVTKEKLAEWNAAKVMAIKSFTTDPEVVIALQEMFIELKQLRRENMRYLNFEDLLSSFAEYVRLSRELHYVDDDLEALIDQIEGEIDRRNLNLEVS